MRNKVSTPATPLQTQLCQSSSAQLGEPCTTADTTPPRSGAAAQPLPAGSSPAHHTQRSQHRSQSPLSKHIGDIDKAVEGGRGRHSDRKVHKDIAWGTAVFPFKGLQALMGFSPVVFHSSDHSLQVSVAGSC